ncbi:hypothetical protein, partial [Streptomyces sp. NPDC007205]|uniref:DNA-3-methyladenine glycosylase family protein n=1 Tax=Streptomyces sp. NPDC007205 TaxID=3154316 RepID=UPI0033E074CA
MYTFTITPQGPFSLAAGLSFLKGFTPARYHDTAQDQALRLAFPTDDGHSTVGVEVRQADAPQGTVEAEAIVHTGPPREGRAGTATETEPVPPSPGVDAVRQQLARILSLDVDGSGFPQLAQRDPVVAELISAYPGLRPVCFHSPYEAAAWAVIGHRIRMVQAAAIKTRIAEHHGQHVTVSGRTLHAFPTPLVLRQLDRIPGLPDTKAERLRHLADAALAGDLDASHLRAMPAQDALAHLRTLPGIGPLFRRADPHPWRRTPRPLPTPRAPTARRDGASLRPERAGCLRREPPRRHQRPLGALPQLGRPPVAHAQRGVTERRRSHPTYRLLSATCASPRSDSHRDPASPRLPVDCSTEWGRERRTGDFHGSGRSSVNAQVRGGMQERSSAGHPAHGGRIAR